MEHITKPSPDRELLLTQTVDLASKRERFLTLSTPLSHTTPSSYFKAATGRWKTIETSNVVTSIHCPHETRRARQPALGLSCHPHEGDTQQGERAGICPLAPPAHGHETRTANWTEINLYHLGDIFWASLSFQLIWPLLCFLAVKTLLKQFDLVLCASFSLLLLPKQYKLHLPLWYNFQSGWCIEQQGELWKARGLGISLYV